MLPMAYMIGGWIVLFSTVAYLMMFFSIRKELMRDFPVYWRKFDDPDARWLKDWGVMRLILSSRNAPVGIRERFEGRLRWSRRLILLNLTVFALAIFHGAHMQGLKHLQP